MLYETENFLAVPGLGAFYDGYVMIVPKSHIMSFAELEEEKFEEKEQWVAYLKGDNQELIDKAKQDNKYIKRLDELLENYWKQEKME